MYYACERIAYKVGWNNIKGKDHWEDRDIERRIIFNWISKK
jgi:hypothetical protein